MKIYLWLGAVLIINILSACSKNEIVTVIRSEVEVFDPVDVDKTHDQALFMHYMPWFETKESSSNNSWGYHWSMVNQNPDIVDADGKHQIASHFYPKIGPYHSGDKDVIEYHLLLMKYAGIDGVLIDWYGSFDLNDYAINRENTEQLIELIDEVGLKFAIVYEDRFLDQIVDAGMASNMENAAKADMQYLETNYFSHPNYYQVNNQPLLLVFGPNQLNTPEAWTAAFSGLTTKPIFLTYAEQSGKAGNNAQGEYAWVFEGNEVAEDEFYNSRIQDIELAMGSAYPGFVDFYEEGGAGDIINFTIDHADGATFSSKLQKVKNADIDMVQLITWNDFGEGTIIEPTLEFGFSYVEKVREFAGVSSTNLVFEDIYNMYLLRKKYADKQSTQKKLDQAFYYFVSMQTDKALEKLESIE